MAAPASKGGNQDVNVDFQPLHLLHCYLLCFQEKAGWAGRNIFNAPQLITSDPPFRQSQAFH